MIEAYFYVHEDELTSCTGIGITMEADYNYLCYSTAEHDTIYERCELLAILRILKLIAAESEDVYLNIHTCSELLLRSLRNNASHYIHHDIHAEIDAYTSHQPVSYYLIDHDHPKMKAPAKLAYRAAHKRAELLAI